MQRASNLLGCAVCVNLGSSSGTASEQVQQSGEHKLSEFAGAEFQRSPRMAVEVAVAVANREHWSACERVHTLQEPGEEAVRYRFAADSFGCTCLAMLLSELYNQTNNNEANNEVCAKFDLIRMHEWPALAKMKPALLAASFTWLLHSG